MFTIRRLRVSTFVQGAIDETETPLAWKVYGWCSENDPESLAVIRRLTEFSKKDASAVVDGLIKLLQRASSGQPLEKVYDKKQCHEALTFNYKNKEYKVWRIWPGGVVRIYFMYGNGKRVVIAWALAKREDKLTNAEKNELETLFTQFIQAQAENKLNEIN